MNIILKALGNIDEKYISEVEEKLPKFNVRKLILPLVACFMIIVGVSIWQFGENYFGMSTSDGATSESYTTDDKDETIEDICGATGLCIVSGDSYLIIIDNCPVVMINDTGDESIFDNLQTGDTIAIEFSQLMETYPGKTTIYYLEILEKGSIEDVPQEIIDSLNELNWEITE
ncbi:MAG: hypothetical protein R3Y35_09070 [Clostridia bacterium]